MPEEIFIEDPGTQSTIELTTPVINQEVTIDTEIIETSVEIESESFTSEIEITDKAPLNIEFVFNEIPAGLLNGSNATFSTEFDFRPESLKVRVNGLQQVILTDYQILDTHTFIFTDSPVETDFIEVDYLKL